MASERVTFAAVLRVREFRVLWFADSQSAIGDQLARVALSILVYQRTSSAVWTALVYALTFFPALLGGVLLSGLADRLPRRGVLVGCDLVRAVLLAIMAVPGLPLWILCVLLVLAVLTESPFIAAESSLIPNILDGDQYVVGTALRTITNQVAQLAGFAGGGILIAAIGARAGLAVDAATFAVSAVLIVSGIHARPAAVTEQLAKQLAEQPAALMVEQATDQRPVASTENSDPRFLAGLKGGLRLIFGDPRLRTLLGLSWLAGLFVVPEGVAAPYADGVHGGSVATGMLLAAMPAGTAVGTYLWVRFLPAAVRPRLMGLTAAATGVPLAACLGHPGLVASLILWAVSGIFFGYQVQVITEFVRAVPDQQRGQAIGIASSGLLAVQGVGVLIGGLIAGVWGVNAAVATAGSLGTVLALALSWSWHRASTVEVRTSSNAAAVSSQDR